MSVIDLRLTPNLSDAVSCKTSNDTVSGETLGKLRLIALALYQIGNSSDWPDACRQLGMIESGVRSNNLYSGFIDVSNAKEVVDGMGGLRAKWPLYETLCDIQRLIHARAKEFMNLIILREDICLHAFKEHGKVILLNPNAGGRSDSRARAYEEKLEEAYQRLGVKWAQEAEQRREIMIAARSKGLEGGGQPCSWQSLQRSGLFDGPSDFYRASRRP